MLARHIGSSSTIGLTELRSVSDHPAARIADTFGQKAQREVLAAGVAVGALLALGVIATGGLGAVAIGAALATGGTAAFAVAAIGKQLAGLATGELTTSSCNVFVNGLPATRMLTMRSDVPLTVLAADRPAIVAEPARALRGQELPIMLMRRI